MRELTHITVVYNKKHPDFSKLSAHPFEPCGVEAAATYDAIAEKDRLMAALEKISEAMSMGEVKNILSEAGI